MNFEQKIRHSLKELGFRKEIDQEIQKMGLQLTVCQLIVVVLSILSVVFLFLPILQMKNFWFMLGCLFLALLCLTVSIYFWIKRSEICEHPEEIDEE